MTISTAYQLLNNAYEISYDDNNEAYQSVPLPLVISILDQLHSDYVFQIAALELKLKEVDRYAQDISCT